MTASRTSKVFALSFGKGLTAFVAIVSGMVLSRVLTKTDLATYRQTMLAYDVAMPLLSLGLVYGMQYFLPTEKSRARGVVVDGLLMMMGMGLLYAVFIALGGNHLLARRFSNPAVAGTLAYLVPLPIVMLPAGLLASVMVVQNQIRKLTIYNVLASLLLAAGVIGACLWWKTPEAMVLVRVGISIATGLVAIRFMLQAVPRDDWHPRWSRMKSMVSYSLPLAGATAMGTLSLQLDKLIVSSMCSPEEFAVYSNGAIEIPLIGILTGSISSILVVEFRKAFAAGDHAEALKLYRLVPAKTSLFLFPVMVYLALAAKPFICVLFSEKYAESSTAFTLYLLMIPYRTVMFGSLAATGKSRAVFWISTVGLLLNLLLSVLLVRLFGYLGAVVGTVASLGLWGIPAGLLEMGRSIHAPMSKIYPWRTAGMNLLLAGAAGLPAAAILWAMPRAPHLVRLGTSAAAYGVGYLALLAASGRLDLERMRERLLARRNRGSP